MSWKSNHIHHIVSESLWERSLSIIIDNFTHLDGSVCMQECVPQVWCSAIYVHDIMLTLITRLDSAQEGSGCFCKIGGVQFHWQGRCPYMHTQYGKSRSWKRVLYIYKPRRCCEHIVEPDLVMSWISSCSSVMALIPEQLTRLNPRRIQTNKYGYAFCIQVLVPYINRIHNSYVWDHDCSDAHDMTSHHYLFDSTSHTPYSKAISRTHLFWNTSNQEAS